MVDLFQASGAILFFVCASSPAMALRENVAAFETPELVAPGVVSRKDRHEFGSVVSKDGSRLYIGVDHGEWSSIEWYAFRDGGWREGGRVLGEPDFSANDPFLSFDGGRLYFISPRNGQHDIGYVEQISPDVWGAPAFEDPPINSPGEEYYISFTRRGDFVFASDRDAARDGDFDIYRAVKGADGRFAVERFPDGVNGDGYEADAFIDPDGRYLVFSSNREGGFGRGDLYVSFAASAAGWTAPRWTRRC